MDLLFGTKPSTYSSSSTYQPRLSDNTNFPAKPAFTDLSGALDTFGYANYAGIGAGASVVHYPSEFRPGFEWQLFLGHRWRHLGVELGYSQVGEHVTAINSQPVAVSNRLYALSFAGFIPLREDTDFFLKYGWTKWRAIVNSNPPGSLLPTSGSSQLEGIGVEFRRGINFLRIEKEIYREAYYSNFHSYLGISWGQYFY